MKIMQISTSIDVNDPNHVEALKQFMDALGGGTAVKAAPLKKVVEEEEKETPMPKKAKAKKPAPDPEPEEEETEETEETEDDDALLGNALDLVKLREATAEKAGKFRAEIKAKLAEFGASNVSALKETDFQAYYEFVTGL